MKKITLFSLLVIISLHAMNRSELRRRYNAGDIPNYHTAVTGQENRAEPLLKNLLVDGACIGAGVAFLSYAVLAADYRALPAANGGFLLLSIGCCKCCKDIDRHL